MKRLVVGSVAAATLGILTPPEADAGGLGRPNVISARAFGYGGAFTAVADDASALHFNPAGLALQPKNSFLFGGELIFAPRSYTPLNPDGTTGEPQKPNNAPAIVPTLGFVGRPKLRGVPSRLAFGVGVWNTFGGQLSYPKGPDNVPAFESVQDAVIEVVPGIGYEVNDFLSIGASLRVGLGLFAVKAESKPEDAEFSAFGIGAATTLGLLLRPSDSLSIGLVWRSGLTIETSGDGELLREPPEPVEVTHTQNWPQQAAIGLAYRVTPRLRLAAQADWTDWSTVEKIAVHFPGRPALDTVSTFDADWNDTFTVHAGGEYQVSPRLALRAGYSFDSAAVPDRTIERQYLDAPKHTADLGAGFQFSESWRIDTAFEYIFGPAREVEYNRDEYEAAGWGDRANVAPGTHEGNVYTFELQVQFQY